MNWDDIRAIISSNAQVAWSVLTSESAVRVYVLVFSGILLAVSLWRALKERTVLTDSTKKALAQNLPGPKPRSHQAKQKQRDLKLSRLKGMLLALLTSTARMMAFGVLVPVFFLWAGTTYYSWFDPNAVVLVSQAGGTPVLNPSSPQLLLYVTDQLLRGGLFDVLEVFKVQVAGLSNNPVVLPYSIGLIAFRAAIDGYMIFALYFVLRTSVSMRKAMRDVNAGLAASPSNPLPDHSNA
ncbi:hypothetical protein [Brevundimonas sp. SL161]|uniref:hypothetical protein n=1 Tax=Brevundimonas sp. SL161 TaxID=2804613 RepID=UPI003CFB611F